MKYSYCLSDAIASKESISLFPPSHRGRVTACNVAQTESSQESPSPPAPNSFPLCSDVRSIQKASILVSSNSRLNLLSRGLHCARQARRGSSCGPQTPLEPVLPVALRERVSDCTAFTVHMCPAQSSL